MSTNDTQLVAGVDEAGRGPLAGPVIAAAVILDPDQPIEGLADSKKLSEGQRERLYAEILQKAFAWSVGRAEVAEIDRLNILNASLAAMRRAVDSLAVNPWLARVDGNRSPDLSCPVEAVIGGDRCVPAISAASILAKVTRDREMRELDTRFPGYGFARHKGYPTRLHIQALRKLGVSTVHRLSFGPVRRIAEEVRQSHAVTRIRGGSE